MPSFTLTVNGAQRTVDVAADTPLIYVLRNELQLTGTAPRLRHVAVRLVRGARRRQGDSLLHHAGLPHRRPARSTRLKGCRGSGRRRRSCRRAAADTLHPIQAAWIDEQVPQCGYCQSGMMIAAADLLEKNPNPDVAQIKDAFTNAPPSAHLCRCGTYSGIVAAVQQAAQLMNA